MKTTGRIVRCVVFVLCAHAGAGALAGQDANDLELIAPGHPWIDARGIEPYDTEIRLLVAADDGFNEFARFSVEVRLVHHTADEPAIFSQWNFLSESRMGLDLFYLHRETLRPIAHYVTAPTGMWVHFQQDGEFIATLTQRTGAEPLSYRRPLEHGRFHGVMLDLLMASLPLEEGMSFRVPGIHSASNIDAALGSEWRADVRGVEPVPHLVGVSARVVGDLLVTGSEPSRVIVDPSAARKYAVA